MSIDSTINDEFFQPTKEQEKKLAALHKMCYHVADDYRVVGDNIIITVFDENAKSQDVEIYPGGRWKWL